MPTFTHAPQEAIGVLWNGYIVGLHATVFAAGVVILVPFMNGHTARSRSSVYAAALVGMLIVSMLCYTPVGWWAWLLPSAPSAPLFWLGEARLRAAATTHDMQSATPAIALCVWLAGSAVVLVRAMMAYASLHLVTRRATPLLSDEWRRVLRETSIEMETGNVAELRMSDAIDAPLVWGILDPIILVPVSAVRWTPEERRLVLLHELAHVRRFDALVQLLAELTFAWYWFHPGVWWLRSRLRLTREMAADELVVRAGIQRSKYASFLLDLADRTLSRRWAPVTTGMLSFMPRHSVTSRVSAVLETPRKPMRHASSVRRGVFALLMLWLMMVGTVRLAPQRSLVRNALHAKEWTRRAYAAQLLSATRSPEMRQLLRDRAATESNMNARRIMQRASNFYR